MDVFVRNVPVNATRKQIEDFFRGPLAQCGITTFHVEKMRAQHLATVTVLDAERGQQFLISHGGLTNRLFWDGKFIQINKSKFSSDFSVRSLEHEASQKQAKASSLAVAEKGKNERLTRYSVLGIRCGSWDYSQSRLIFMSHYNSKQPGTVSLGLTGAVILLVGPDGGQHRVDISYEQCHNIVLGSYEDPTITFTLRHAPKFYKISGEDIATAQLSALILGSNAPKRDAPKKTRVPSLDDSRPKVFGHCFVYRMTLASYNMLSTVKSLLGHNSKVPPVVTLACPTRQPHEQIERSIDRLDNTLTDVEIHGNKPFKIRYQIDRLVRNGILPPTQVMDLLPKVFEIYQQHNLEATLSALTRFSRQVPLAGPTTDASKFSKKALEARLEALAADYTNYRFEAQNPYELTKRHIHINLIHKIIVTPAGIHLEGPEPEPTNRVLRRYSDRIDSFTRVIFQDEDGGSVRYDPLSSHDVIYHTRFKSVLDKGINVTGQSFSFLGFSHSSLRAQSCWFMAPIPIPSERTLKLPRHVLKELGDFSNIRVPAKCAARIGQNFTDTNATVDLEEADVGQLPLILNNDYDFSDGVGTISEDLLRRVWGVYGRRRMLKPTALQIRFQGSKGMVSLDSRLRGQHLMLRSNMKKFEAPNTWNLEICGAGFKPLPMILNRQFIKILEDLGISENVFLNLQDAAVEELRSRTDQAINIATFLENDVECTKATGIPTLIRQLDEIGIDYRQDEFLYGVVEMAIVTKLRDIKYRGRIPVKGGVTLYGIMDETGYLREGEIYVVTETPPEGGRKVHVQPNVIVTRSPAMHPGDVQIVNAVDVPQYSPLKQLSNVIVFSQHGSRDLPSQLSGGDLDGDLYNVIWDERLIPEVTYTAAQYPRVSAVDLDHEVTSKDMSDFFVTFMESDLLGVISNIHMQLADQRQGGTFHQDCLTLASMASTAVDFSKTGIPVNMKECPRYEKYRPDFMAMSPRIVVSDQGHLELEEEDDENDTAFDGLDAERRPYRYYKSTKVLGQLYRSIDEGRFLAKMQEKRSLVTSKAPYNALEALLKYMRKLASQYGILYDHHQELARAIRASYEDSLLDILYHYEPTPHMPVSEHEAFAGTILGRKTGVQGKPLRELSRNLRERFESVVEYTILRIVKGDEQMQGVNDLDLLYDDSLDREVEALPRALACLVAAVEEEGTFDLQLGELQSFKYVAAAVCLRELERFMITTLGRYALPRV